MLEAYSVGLAVTADSPVTFNSVSVEKGCTARLASPSTIELNKCGVYMVSVDATASVSTTLQLVKDGIAQPQAQATGTNPSFVTFVQVPTNNSCCACASPTKLTVQNAEAVTLDNVNVCVSKLC